VSAVGGVGMSKIEEAITEWFGARCPDYEKGCVVCQVWKEFDDLVVGKRVEPEENSALAERVIGD